MKVETTSLPIGKSGKGSKSTKSAKSETISRPSGKSDKGTKSAKGAKSMEGKSSKNSKKDVLGLNAVDRTTYITANGGCGCRESYSWGVMIVTSVMIMCGYFLR